MEKRWEYNGTVRQRYTDFKKACGSVRREVLYSILIEFDIPMKLVRKITKCLNEIYSKVRIFKNLFNTCPIQNGLEQGDTLSPFLFNFDLECANRKVQEKQRGIGNEWDTSASSLG
jgi:hypothetical protein